jgi:hypothetical protein
MKSDPYVANRPATHAANNQVRFRLTTPQLILLLGLKLILSCYTAQAL